MWKLDRAVLAVIYAAVSLHLDALFCTYIHGRFNSLLPFLVILASQVAISDQHQTRVCYWRFGREYNCTMTSNDCIKI